MSDQSYQGFSLDKSVRFYVTYDEENSCFVADVFDPKFEHENYGKANWFENLESLTLGFLIFVIHKS